MRGVDRPTKNHKFLKEYERFYLYVYIDRNGNELYKETFLKIYVDEIQPVRRCCGNIGRYTR